MEPDKKVNIFIGNEKFLIIHLMAPSHGLHFTKVRFSLQTAIIKMHPMSGTCEYDWLFSYTDNRWLPTGK